MIKVIILAILLLISIITLVLSMIKRNTKLTIAAIVITIVVASIGIVLLYSRTPVIETEESTETNQEQQEENTSQRVWEMEEVNTEQLEIKSNDDIMTIANPLLTKYTSANNLPPATYVDKSWTESDGTHAYIQSTFGDQTYEVLVTDEKICLDFYGSTFHKGCKGVSYGSCVMRGVNVPKIESELISMGYGNLLFTFKEVGDDYVLLESETGFEQRLSK